GKARKEGAKAVSDAINKEMEKVRLENIRKHGIDNQHPRVDREAEYQAALKVAMETVIEQSINEITDGKEVKQAVSRSRDAVKNAAYKLKRDVIDKAETARTETLRRIPPATEAEANIIAERKAIETQKRHNDRIEEEIKEIAKDICKVKGIQDERDINRAMR